MVNSFENQPTIKVSSFDKNPSLWRMWKGIPRSLREVLLYRTAIGKRLGYGVMKDALNADFQILKADGTPDETTNKKLTQEIKNNTDEVIINARAAKYFFGYSVIGWIEFETVTDKSSTIEEPVLFWIEDDYINELETVPGTKIIRKLSFQDPRTDGEAGEPLVFNGVKECENFRLVANLDKEIGTYRAEVDSIVDPMVGTAIHLEQMILLEIRTGSGVRFVKAPRALLDDATNKKKLETTVENWGQNIGLLYPDTVEGEDIEFTLYFGEGGTPFDHAVTGAEYMKQISIDTGYPATYLMGEMMGLRSAEENKNSVYDNFVLLRKEVEHLKLAAIGWQLDIDLSDRKIDYFPLVEVSEKEKVSIEIEKMLALQDLDPALFEVIPKDKILKNLSIDIEFDAEMQRKYEEAKTRREELNSMITKGNQGQEDDDEDSETTEEE